MDQESYRVDVENSFLYFLITLQKLHLSLLIGSMMLSQSHMILKGFVWRNERYVRKPEGILIL